jgi:uncharacterized DUF497 family protein
VGFPNQGLRHDTARAQRPSKNHSNIKSAQDSSISHKYYSYIHKLVDQNIIRIYNNYMEISFDTTKDNANLEKHGISLAAAVMIEWDDALTWADDRHNYGEARMCAIAYIGERLHYVVYVDRAEARRVISLRKANLREVKRYAEA